MKWAVAVLATFLMASLASGQDVTVNISVTIPEAYVQDMAATMEWMNDHLYSNSVVVTEGVTNVVEAVVAETARAKLKRISSRQVIRFWAGKLRQYRALQQEASDPVTTD